MYFCVDSDPEYTADRNTVMLTGFSEQMLRSNVLLPVPLHFVQTKVLNGKLNYLNAYVNINVVELPASC